MAITMTRKEWKSYQTILKDKNIETKYPDIANEIKSLCRLVPKLHAKCNELETIIQKHTGMILTMRNQLNILLQPDRVKSKE